MGCTIPSFLLAVYQWGDLWGALFLVFLLAVHQWGDLWRALFLAFYLQYISGEICGEHYS